jgi:uncharacterized protein YfdQ (DUF2303 family)
MSEEFDDIHTDASTNAQAIIEAMSDLGKTEEFMVTDGADKTKVIVVAKGREAVGVEKFLAEVRARPRRHKGFAELRTIRSFVDFCKTYGNEDAVVFVDDTPTRPSMCVVVNYHETNVEQVGRAGHRDYGAKYCFPLSDEWKAWEDADGEPMDQRRFAEFLEDRIVDVIEPKDPGADYVALAKRLGLEAASPSKLLTLARGLTIHVASKVAEHRNLSTGEGQVAFEEAHKDGQGAALRVPGLFVISIPVFRRGAFVSLAVRLRYRVRSGQITWTVKLHQADVAYQQAIEEAVFAVNTALEGTQVLWGVQAPV